MKFPFTLPFSHPLEQQLQVQVLGSSFLQMQSEFDEPPLGSTPVPLQISQVFSPDPLHMVQVPL